ncbi:MAG TPA: cytochrome c [Thermoanaerobaculia bacterium]|nr:cytochrome c [Thermoanaerobaculia bacterium]
MKTLAVAFSILFTGVLLATSYSGEAQAQKVLDGKQIFLAQKCNLCHSVSPAGIEATTKSEKMKGPDLVGESKRDAKLLNGYLRKTADINGKKHVKQFTGSDEEIGALIAWLQKQEK